MSIDRSEIVSAYTETTWRATTSCSSSSSYHVLLFKLLLVDIDYNCMRTGFEVCACTVSSPHIRKKNLFHKLIRVIQMFARHGSQF